MINSRKESLIGRMRLKINGKYCGLFLNVDQVKGIGEGDGCCVGERDSVVDKHERVVFFRGGVFSDGGVIWEFTYCTIIGEVCLLNKGDVYVVFV